jgi:hypothetical protein
MRQDLLEHRSHEFAEFGQMCEAALAADKQPPEFLFELLDCAGERGLRDVASFCRPRKVQRLAQGKEVSDLIELHARTVACDRKPSTNGLSAPADFPARCSAAEPLACTKAAVTRLRLFDIIIKKNRMVRAFRCWPSTARDKMMRSDYPS